MSEALGELKIEKKVDSEKLEQELLSTTEVTEEKVEKSLNYEMLSEEEKKAIDEFVKKVDVTDSAQVLQYGSGAQTKISSFSDSVLDTVKTKNTGEVGDLLADLVANVKDFNTDVPASLAPKGIQGLFFNAKKEIDKLIAKYSKVETNVDKIEKQLETQKIKMLKDITIFDTMYEKNLEYFKELSLYIIAGEKKLDDLKTTRIISLQMAPQIRLIQNNDSELVEKIQSSLINTIPLWKNQIVIALGLANAKSALGVQKAVTDTTNEMLKKNSEMLKQGTIEVAEESEKSIVNVETLQKTNKDIIETLDKVLEIHENGRAKRAEAEAQLVNIEKELKDKMLEIKINNN